MIRKNIEQMSAYKPPLEGRSGGSYLLFDFNERTVPVSPRVKQALIDYIAEDRLQQYPEYGDIEGRLARYAEVPPDRLMITNGSDQGIDLVFRLATEPGDEAIVAAPTFAMLPHSAYVSGLKVFEPPYTDDYQYPLEEVLSLVSARTRIITVCNPNNPTGTLVPPSDLIRLAEAAPQAAVLVDECYYEYTKATVKDRLDQYPNLFITRTFSKTWGMPSLRLGYVLSAPQNIQNLLKVRGPYDVNRLAIVAVQAALEDPQYMTDYVEEVRTISIPLLIGCLQRKGIRFWPTTANFVLLYPPDPDGLVRGLKERGILVRPRSGPKIEGTVRINVGSKSQTERLIAALEEIL